MKRCVNLAHFLILNFSFSISFTYDRLNIKNYKINENKGKKSLIIY